MNDILRRLIRSSPEEPSLAQQEAMRSGLEQIAVPELTSSFNEAILRRLQQDKETVQPSIWVKLRPTLVSTCTSMVVTLCVLSVIAHQGGSSDAGKSGPRSVPSELANSIETDDADRLMDIPNLNSAALRRRRPAIVNTISHEGSGSVGRSHEGANLLPEYKFAVPMYGYRKGSV